MIPFLARLLTRRSRESLADRVAAAMNAPKRMLFVENDDLLRDLFCRLANRFDVDLVSVATAAEAQSQLTNSYFDAAILDVKLPDGNGLDVYRSIAKECPWLDVVFLTSYESQSVRNEIESVGPARIYSKDALTKPWFLDVLFAQLGLHRIATAQ